MAKTTVTTLTDDLNGQPADETVKFSIDGERYEMDLTSANAAKLRAHFAPYIEKAQKRGTAATGGGNDLSAVRAWAASKGIEVGKKGRLPAELLEQFKAENPAGAEKKDEKKSSTKNGEKGKDKARAAA